MDLFDDTESYRMDTVVDDSRKFIRKKYPQELGEDNDDYNERLFYLINDEIERRILISGKKRPNYYNQNIRFKKGR